MRTKIHAAAGVIGFLCILTFWTSTAFSELFASHETVAAVKAMILRGMFILIPAMVIVGASGMSMGAKRQDALAISKKRRMPIIALNGLLILLPSAFFLASKAAAGAFDTAFYTIQGVELLAGAVNLSLIGLNIRDGLRMTGRIGGKAAPLDNRPTIEQRENGPLVLKGVNSISGPDAQAIACRPATALCRCGASKNKPFCDGSHNNIGFQSACDDVSSRDKVFTYHGNEATIHYNRLLCSHAAECSKRLPSVFDPNRKPWIEPDNGQVSDLQTVVRACPSGALRISTGDDEPQHLTDNKDALTVEENGPYRVSNIALDETKWATGASNQKYVLCRCGQSGNKPFCDGSHHDSGWRDG